jgi:hypothetical protein
MTTPTSRIINAIRFFVAPLRGAPQNDSFLFFSIHNPQSEIRNVLEYGWQKGGPPPPWISLRLRRTDLTAR